MTVLSTAARNAACNAIVDLLDGGTIEMQTAADAVVATLTFGTPAYGNAVDGVATANAITADDDTAAGTVTKAVLKNSADETIMTLTVSLPAGTGDIRLSSVTYNAGDTLGLSSLTHTQPAQV
jgi:hypothetical protein